MMALIRARRSLERPLSFVTLLKASAAACKSSASNTEPQKRHVCEEASITLWQMGQRASGLGLNPAIASSSFCGSLPLPGTAGANHLERSHVDSRVFLVLVEQTLHIDLLAGILFGMESANAD